MKCNYCSQETLIRKGKRGIKQRYQCKNCGKYQQDVYSYKLYDPSDDIWIKKYNSEGVGICSMSRILEYSVSTILRRILYLREQITKPIYSEDNQVYEVDEMWTFVGSKYPIDGDLDANGQIVASSEDGLVDFYTADVIAYNDYYPYGMLLPASCQEVDFQAYEDIYSENFNEQTSTLNGWNTGSPFDADTESELSSDGKLHFTTTIQNGHVKYDHTLVVGQTYTMSMYITCTATSPVISFYDGSLTTYPVTQGYNEFTFTAASSFAVIGVAEFGTPTDTSEFYVDDVKLIRLDGAPATDSLCYGNDAGEYRYSFNGMEDDDEIKGARNSYDFGARLYDPRVGRWIKTDVQESEMPSITPYRMALNNPIRYKDPNGEFEIEASVAEAYPNFAAYLQNLVQTYSDKPEEFKRAFKHFSQLSDNEVKAMLTYTVVEDGAPLAPGSANPRISVENLTGANGETPFTGTLNRQTNEVTNTVPDGVIRINTVIVDMYEAAPNDMVAELLLESTLFHEGTHYGDLLDGSEDMTTPGAHEATQSTVKMEGGKPVWAPGTKEGGKSFEIQVYGEDVNMENASKIIDEQIKAKVPQLESNESTNPNVYQPSPAIKL